MAPSHRTGLGRSTRTALASLVASAALAGCASDDLYPPLHEPEPPPVATPAPAPDTAVYTVERGDTLSAIARRHGVSATALAEANQLADPHRLAPGQRLVVPAAPLAETGASPIRPVAAAAPPPRRAPAAPAVSSAPPLAFVPSARDREREYVCVDAWIDEGQAYLRGARYEEAIESAQKARAALEQLDGPDAGPRAARLEILSGSAEVALGRTGDAHASFSRALAAEPALLLDDAAVSPKVVRAFEETRKSREPSASVAGAPSRPQFGDDVASDASTTAQPASY